MFNEIFPCNGCTIDRCTIDGCTIDGCFFSIYLQSSIPAVEAYPIVIFFSQRFLLSTFSSSRYKYLSRLQLLHLSRICLVDDNSKERVGGIALRM